MKYLFFVLAMVLSWWTYDAYRKIDGDFAGQISGEYQKMSQEQVLMQKELDGLVTAQNHLAGVIVDLERGFFDQFKTIEGQTIKRINEYAAKRYAGYWAKKMSDLPRSYEDCLSLRNSLSLEVAGEIERQKEARSVVMRRIRALPGGSYAGSLGVFRGLQARSAREGDSRVARAEEAARKAEQLQSDLLEKWRQLEKELTGIRSESGDRLAVLCEQVMLVNEKLALLSPKAARKRTAADRYLEFLYFSMKEELDICRQFYVSETKVLYEEMASSLREVDLVLDEGMKKSDDIQRAIDSLKEQELEKKSLLLGICGSLILLLLGASVIGFYRRYAKA